MGDVYYARKDYELATKFYGSVINLAKEQKNTELEANIKIKIGKTFYDKGEKETATAFWGVRPIFYEFYFFFSFWLYLERVAGE